MLKIFLTMFMILNLSACVTNTTGKSIPKADKEKALASHIQLGLGYLRNKNLDLARYHFEKALKFNANSPGALNGQALMYQIEGETDLAEQYFVKALAQDPGFSQARNNFAIYLFQQKRYEEAYTAFETVSRDMQYSHRAGALLNLGRAAKRVDKIDRAEAVFKQAVALSPRLTQALIELAEIKFNQKEFAESKRYLDRFSSSSRQTARSLWLSIRIEQVFDNKDKIASHALALKNLFPYSKEYLEYQKSIEN
jgi:type IV pilus assembly protein PilF